MSQPIFTVHPNDVVEVHDAVRYQRATRRTDLVTCGACGRTWDDAVSTSTTPAPSGRCPFEYDHAERHAFECVAHLVGGARCIFHQTAEGPDEAREQTWSDCHARDLDVVTIDVLPQRR